MRTLRCSFIVFGVLANKVYNGWFRAPMTSLPMTSLFSLDEKLRILWIIDQEGSWMKIMSKSLLFSKKVSVRSLFL